MSIGSILNNICDKFLPDCVGDLIGAAVDGAMGNWVGMAVNTADFVEDVLDAAGAHGAADLFETAVDIAATFTGGGGGIESASGTGEGIAQLARGLQA